MKRILFIGDSITDCDHCFTDDNLGTGFVRILSDRMKEKYPGQVQVINGGCDGAVFSRILLKWKQFYQDQHWDMIILNGGINDVGTICNTGLTGDRKQSFLLESIHSLENMIHTWSDQKIPYFVLLPHIFYTADYHFHWTQTLQELTGMMLCVIPTEHYVSLSYIYSESKDPERDITDSEDGIHPSTQGHIKLADYLFPLIQTSLFP